MSAGQFIQFFREEQEALGSDGVLRFDGRLSTSTCLALARAHAARLNKNLNKGYTHLSLRVGSYSRYHELIKRTPL